MKLFWNTLVREAEAYAAQGGQALHVTQHDWDPHRYGRDTSHIVARTLLFDQNRRRLVRTVKSFGVCRPIVQCWEEEQHEGQHVDLSIDFLSAAVAQCKRDEDKQPDTHRR